MMKKKVDVAVIGAGSAGLTAFRQVEKATDNCLLVDHGPLGTTCARVGCMPSKVLIRVAKDFHRREAMAEEGILGGERLSCDIPAVLRHVRRLRDRFVEGMVDATERLAGDRLVRGAASLLGPDRIALNGEEIECGRIILAVGSRPTVPKKWSDFGEKILTSENLFEKEDLPRRLAVIGLGPIGLELGQALARLGLGVTGFDLKTAVGGAVDPGIAEAALEAFRREFPLHVGSPVEVAPNGDGLLVRSGVGEVEVDAVVAATGVTPNVAGLGLERLGVELNKRGLPPFNPCTMQVADMPVFIAGDANGCRPVLHEAIDEGFIAGRNAVAPDVGCYCRRTPLRIVFSDPQIAAVGVLIKEENSDRAVIGRADFADQSRAVVEGRNVGLLHVRADRETARLTGAEMVAPDGEHLAHLLALAVQKEMTVHEALGMPFYHPTIEEGLRSALRDAARQMADRHPADELSLCNSVPERPLC